MLMMNHLSLITGQIQPYSFDIAPNSRLIQSLGLNLDNVDVAAPITTTTTTSRNQLSSNYALNSYRPRIVSSPLLLQDANAFTRGPQAVTYLTVGERPRTIRPRDRTQTVFTVSDVNRRRLTGTRRPTVPVYTNEVSDEAPKPYSFEYDAVHDESGSRSSRSEQSDGKTVTGSYSYVDADGVYRTVSYIADEGGFRANVKTNEPGTSKSSATDPANTQWEVESPPEAVLVKYLKKY